MLSDEIAQAIANNATTDQVDEGALEDELEALEQETMDERMLKTGTVPVGDRINQLPTAANGERKPVHPTIVCRPDANRLKTVRVEPKQTAEEEDEEAELERLRAQMAM